VKVQGHRIELGEIEAAIATHPDVAEVAVAALPRAGEQALHAFVVPRRQAWDRARFLLERHGLRRLLGAAGQAIPARPEPAAYARRSVRRFTPEPVALAGLEAVLAAIGAVAAGTASPVVTEAASLAVAGAASPAIRGAGGPGQAAQPGLEAGAGGGGRVGRGHDDEIGDACIPSGACATEVAGAAASEWVEGVQAPAGAHNGLLLAGCGGPGPLPTKDRPGAALSIQVIATRVDGLAPGLLRYDPDTHTLHPLGPAPAWSVPDPGTARVAGAAAFLLLIEADTPDRRTALLAAGAAGQRMMDAALMIGLGLCPIGVLLRDGAPVLHSLAGGAPAAQAAGFDLAGAVREHAAAQLPAYMVPRHIHLREALPLSANGKLDRAALRPPEDIAATAAPDTAPDTALAVRVGALVAEIIGGAVHPQRNLFDCGATSLHIVRLQRRLAEELGSRLAVVDLFRLPSVAALATAIAGEAGPDAVDAGLARAARRRQMRGRGGV
jgi:nitroreductase/aryl carrier-like protein